MYIFAKNEDETFRLCYAISCSIIIGTRSKESGYGLMNKFFEKGSAKVGEKDVAFEKRKIRGNFTMYIPASFSEDKTIVSNYSYLFSKDKSPLSIAIKYSPFTAAVDRDRMIDSYFSRSHETRFAETEDTGEGILYRETVTSSEYMSVYSLRFSVDVKDGVLFGCFNCAADYKNDWKPVVIEMLKNISGEAPQQPRDSVR